MPILLASGFPEAPSRVVNMRSVTGTLPIGGNAYSYAASKAAVHHLTRVPPNEFVARHKLRFVRGPLRALPPMAIVLSVRNLSAFTDLGVNINKIIVVFQQKDLS
jgi:hypothetical protein